MSFGLSYGFNEILVSEETTDTGSGASQKKDSTSINIQAGVTQILSATVISSFVVESGVFSTALMIDPHLKIAHKRILISKSLELFN